MVRAHSTRRSCAGATVAWRRWGKSAFCAVLVLVLAASLVALVGCRDSKALKEIVHTQDAEEIDYDSDVKVAVPSDDGEAQNAQTDAYEVVDESTNVEYQLLNVVYSSDPETDLPTARFVYDPNGTYDTEASEDADSPTQEQEQSSTGDTVGEERKGDNTQDSGEAQSESGATGNPEDDQTGSGDEGSAKDPDDKKGGSSTPESENVEEKGGGEGKRPDPTAEPTVYDTTGEVPEIPQVKTLAACGQTAVVAQMLAGPGALVAADADLLGGAFSQVFADEGAAAIRCAWSADGSSSSLLDMAALVEASPETVLVESSTYFTEAQRAALGQAGISITVVPPLNSDTSILKLVDTVGQMLSGRSADDPSVDTVANAAAYRAFHDRLLGEVMAASGGYSAYNGTVYDRNTLTPPHTVKARVWGLLVDAWDYDARFDGTFNGKANTVKASQGVGFSRIGYGFSPVSYYLGAGGIVNNAAAIEVNAQLHGLYSPVWQFNANALPPSKSRWSGYGPLSPLAGDLYTIDNTALSKLLLQVADKQASVGNDMELGLGGSVFPLAIVKTGRMRTAFLRDAATEKGIYSAYLSEEQGVTGVGLFVNGAFLESSVHPDADLEDVVVVNPQGLFSDWTQGSAESFLEAAWVASLPQVDGDWEGSVESEVASFYRQFYRYDLSGAQVQAILGGAE